MLSERIDELQLRALSGMHRHPSLFKDTPQYLFGVEPWLTVRNALVAYHDGQVGFEALLRGMLTKYGMLYFDALIDVIDNAQAVPGKGWANTQIRHLMKAIDNAYGQGGGYA